MTTAEATTHSRSMLASPSIPTSMMTWQAVNTLCRSMWSASQPIANFAVIATRLNRNIILPASASV